MISVRFHPKLELVDKFSNIKFNDNSFGPVRYLSCGQMDEQTGMKTLIGF